MAEDVNTELLREILKWTKIQGITQAKGVLTAALSSDKEKLVYEYSDGQHGTIEIGKLAGLGQTTVTRYWSRWATLGIVEPIAVKGGTRYRKMFSLGDFGIYVPGYEEKAASVQKSDITDKESNEAGSTKEQV
jgi:hypothetical protein